MLRRPFCSILLLLFLLPGCSVLKSVTKKKKKAIPQTVQKAPERPAPDPGNSQDTNAVNDADIAPRQSTDSLGDSRKRNEKPQPQPRQKVPVIRFSEAECQHVRLSASQNNPFPASGEMEIDLSTLQNEFCYPYPGKVISPYGYRGRSMHTGMDIKAVPNDTIRAVLPGVVRLSKPYSGYGNVIVIRHYNGIETVYSHNSRNLVAVNDVVQSGEAIALAGRTGRASTEHVHFELRVAGEHLNPTLMVDPDNQRLKDGTLYLSNRGGRIRGSNKALPLYAESQTEASSDEPEDKPTASSGRQSQASSSGASQYHVIQKGDTLSALARKYSTTVSKICALNGIKPTKILQLKERIRVK